MSATSESVSATQVLTTLLTTESLLFAAFALAANFTVNNKGRRKVVSDRFLAVVSVGALVVVACGAGAAWVEVAARVGDDLPSSLRVAGIAVLIAVVVQPVVAVLLALSLRR